MNRRDFLRRLMTVPLASGAFLYGDPLRFNLRAAPASGKTLIVIFQRGGCDGLNTVVPYGDAEYYNLRPGIAVPPPGLGGALNLDGFFGLHPSLVGLHNIYLDGALAVLPAVHYAGAPLSHFDSQYLVESGTPLGSTDGWLNRHLANQSTEAQLRAAAFSAGVPHAFAGQISVPTFANLESLGLHGESEASLEDFSARLRAVYSQQMPVSDTNRSVLHASGLNMLDNIDLLSAIDSVGYQPANGAVYPNDSFSQQLQQTAQLIKEGIGLELVTVDLGGWDTHSDQGGAEPEGAQSQKHTVFANGIQALYTDLGSQMDDVIILTMTEFGRTVKENASGGTDHGKASAWFVIGGRVNGGIYGDWPGLGPEQLSQGRYLQQSIDFRDVMAEVAIGHLENSNLAAVLPGHVYTPLGFL